MTRITISRTIHAPIERVFTTVADIRQFSQAIPHVAAFEFLSDVTSGVGTRFRETRRMKGKETTTELEVTEYIENSRVRMVADSHGTVWDTTFTVTFADGNRTLTLTMDAKAHALLPKLINPLVQGMFKKNIARDMDFVTSFCEHTQHEAHRTEEDI